MTPDKQSSSPADFNTTGERQLVNCPKCCTPVRDVARFCTHCHATLRFRCPSCGHEQRHGGACEKCEIDFLKYISAVIAAKNDEADRFHERLEQRSTLMKNILSAPFTLGIPLIRSLLISRDRKNS